MNARRLLFSFTLMAAQFSGCRFDSRLSGGADITCGAAGECPDGWECIAETNRCRQIGSDAPGLEKGEIVPSIGNRATTFTVSLKVSKPLSRPPTLTPLNFVFDPAQSNPEERTYTYTYTPAGTEKETVYRVSAELKDASGNTALVPVGTVTLDFTPPLPIVGSMKVVPGVARPGQPVLLQIDFDEVLRDTAQLSQPALAIAGLPSTVKNTNTLAFRFDVPPTTASGAYGFTISRIEDLAGNAAEDITPLSQLSVESRLTVDSQAPVIADVVVNRENFSRQPGFDEVVLTFKAGNDADRVTAVMGTIALECVTVGQAAEDTLWRCSHRIDANDTEGSQPLKCTAIDLAGNAATEARSIRLDFTAPSPVAGSMHLTPPAAKVGQTVVAQLNFDEVLVPGATLQQAALGLSNLASSVQNNVVLAFTFPIGVGVADGEYAFGLSGVKDLAGNVATLGTLEQRLVIDSTAPTISAVQFNLASQRYSRATGFNQVVVTFEVSEAAALVSARVGSELMNCTTMTPTTRRCVLTVGTATPEGLAAVQLEARDAVGNGSTSNHTVVFDFTAPQVVAGTLQKTLVPRSNGPLAQIVALGEGASAVISFAVSEALTPGLTLQLGGRPVTCTANQTSVVCTYVHVCSALTDGAQSLAVSMTDLAGNAFSGPPPGATALQTDCTPPPSPNVGSVGKVVWHRAPFGASWSPMKVGLRLELAADALSEAVQEVRVGRVVGAGQVAAVGAGPFVVGQATTIAVDDQVDRVTVSVQAIDGAGNASPVVAVRDVLTTVGFAGSQVSADAPGLFRVNGSQEHLLTDVDAAWGGAQQSSVRVNVTSLPAVPTAVVPAVATLPHQRVLVVAQASTWVFDAIERRRVTLTTPAGVLNRERPTVTSLADGRVLLFGGSRSSVALADSWLFDPARLSWSPVPGLQPTARTSHGLVRVGATTVLLAGGQNGSTLTDDTWVFDAQVDRWRRVTGVEPPGRAGALLQSLANGRALLFSGERASQPLGDTWVFNGQTESWSQVVTVGGPSARLSSLSTTLNDGRVLMFSGADAVGQTNDSWLFDGAQLKWVAVQGAGPGGRSDGALVTLRGDGALLHGGFSSGAGRLSDTWRFDESSESWSQLIAPAMIDRGAAGAAAIGDGDAFIYGGKTSAGESAEAFIFDGSREMWVKVVGAAPATNTSAALTAVAGGLGLLTGGGDSAGFNRVSWLFDPATHLWAPTVGGPDPRVNHGVAALANGDAIVFGGVGVGPQLNDTWRYDGATQNWQQLTPGTQPDERTNVRMVRLGDGRLLLAGGFGFNVQLTDSWLFDPVSNEWQQVSASGGPNFFQRPLVALTDGTAFTYLNVPQQDRSWRFGLNPVGWVESSAAAPPARLNEALVALSGDRALIFGGEGQPSGLLSDTWVYDGATSTWSPLQGAHPPASAGQQLRALNDQLALLFDGATGQGPADSLWVFDADASTWSAVDGVTLPAMLGAASVTLAHDTMLRFGGFRDATSSNDTALVSSRGERLAAMGTVSLKALGLQPSQVVSVSAQATAGATGRSADNQGTLNGAALQVFGRSPYDERGFTSCAQTAATPAAPTVLSCPAQTLAGSAHVALRVLPIGFSNGRPMTVRVDSAELTVTTRLP